MSDPFQEAGAMLSIRDGHAIAKALMHAEDAMLTLANALTSLDDRQHVQQELSQMNGQIGVLLNSIGKKLGIE